MKNNNQHPLKAMALMSSILAQLVGSILIGIFLGRWIDTYFDCPVPVFMIIGLLSIISLRFKMIKVAVERLFV